MKIILVITIIKIIIIDKNFICALQRYEAVCICGTFGAVQDNDSEYAY